MNSLQIFVDPLGKGTEKLEMWYIYASWWYTRDIPPLLHIKVIGHSEMCIILSFCSRVQFIHNCSITQNTNLQHRSYKVSIYILPPCV